MKPNPKDWTDDRCAELDALVSLIREASAINNGSNCLQRISKCIDLAESLNKTDFATGRAGFIRWLEELAIKDRFGATPPTT